VKWILAFVGMVALDLVWARYSWSVARGYNIKAANAAVAIMALTGFVTVSYINDLWMLIPIGAGAWVGTYLGSRLNDK